MPSQCFLVLGWIAFVGGFLCALGCSAASLVSATVLTIKVPSPSPTSVLTVKNVSRNCQMFLKWSELLHDEYQQCVVLEESPSCLLLKLALGRWRWVDVELEFEDLVFQSSFLVKLEMKLTWQAGEYFLSLVFVLW